MYRLTDGRSARKAPWEPGTRPILKETERRQDDLTDVSDEYISHTKTGLGHWIDGGRKDYLAWGILVFRKPE